MTLHIDTRESIEFDLLLSQAVPLERVDLNRLGRPDFYWTGYNDRRIGIESKQAGELLGSIDAVEEQLQRESETVDYLALAIRGVITPHEDGCQVWQEGKNGTVMFRSRVYRQSYKGLQAWKARLWEIGIPVLEAANTEGMARLIVAVYEGSQKPDADHQTFKKFITTKQWLNEVDEEKKALALTLMGVVGGGWGEEIALAVADACTSLAHVMQLLQHDAVFLAGLPLRSGKRKVGNAAVTKMRAAVGL